MAMTAEIRDHDSKLGRQGRDLSLEKCAPHTPAMQQYDRATRTLVLVFQVSAVF